MYVLPHDFCQQVRIHDEALRIQVLPPTFWVPDPVFNECIDCCHVFLLGFFEVGEFFKLVNMINPIFFFLLGLRCYRTTDLAFHNLTPCLRLHCREK